MDGSHDRSLVGGGARTPSLGEALVWTRRASGSALDDPFLMTGASMSEAGGGRLWTGAVVLWCLGTAFLLVRLVIGRRRVRALEREAQLVMEPRILAQAARMCSDLGLRRTVRYLEGGPSTVPMTWGVFGPVVLLPRCAATWPDERLRRVLLHELAHARRYDAAFQLVAELTRAVYWLHPLPWIAAARLRMERELACDDLVLRAGAPPTEYAADLVAITRELRGQRCLSTLGIGMARSAEIRERVVSLLDGEKRRSGVPRGPALVGVGLALTLMLGLSAMRPAETSETVRDGRPPNPSGVPPAVRLDGPAASEPPAGTPIAIEPAARLSVGSATDGLRFERVVTPFLFPDGRLVVPSSGQGSIHVFSPRGELLTTFGWGGTSPLLVDLWSAWARGDTIEALEIRQQRVTRFLPDGSVDVVHLRREGPTRLGSFETSTGGPTSDGWFAGGIVGAEYGGRDEMVVHRFARDGADLGEVARTTGFARFVSPGISGPGPLSPRSLFAVSGEELYVAETETPSIRIFESARTSSREITWAPEPSPSPAQVLAAVVDSAVARSWPEHRAATRLRLEYPPVPERLSVLWAFLVDDEGFIWVRPFEPLRHAAALGGLALASGGPGGVWTIVSPEGVEVGSVQVPDDLELIRITADDVIGVSRDALGVESVRVHPLRRS
jgi:hypothetical protein